MYYGALPELDRKAFDRALAWGGGTLRVGPGTPTPHIADGEEILSTSRACSECGTGIPELDPRWFSFNTKQGQCESCEGTGVRGGTADMDVDDEPAETCRACHGDRLAPIPRSVRLDEETYPRFMEKSVSKALAKVRALRLTGKNA